MCALGHWSYMTVLQVTSSGRNITVYCPKVVPASPGYYQPHKSPSINSSDIASSHRTDDALPSSAFCVVSDVVIDKLIKNDVRKAIVSCPYGDVPYVRTVVYTLEVPKGVYCTVVYGLRLRSNSRTHCTSLPSSSSPLNSMGHSVLSRYLGYKKDSLILSPSKLRSADEISFYSFSFSNSIRRLSMIMRQKS